MNTMYLLEKTKSRRQVLHWSSGLSLFFAAVVVRLRLRSAIVLRVSIAAAPMAEVRARSPGKIIISGEHAVVHGSTAIAAAVDLYTHVSIRPDSPILPGSPPRPPVDVSGIFASGYSPKLQSFVGIQAMLMDRCV